MFSGEKKKYGLYLDGGLMERAKLEAERLGVSLNEYVSKALESFINNTSDRSAVEYIIFKVLEAPSVKEAIAKEINSTIKD